MDRQGENDHRRRVDLKGLPWEGCVSHQGEWAQLKAAVEDLDQQRGGFWWITGPPGSGKARLARQVAAYAAERGCRSLQGSCRPGGRPYGAWVEALVPYFRHRPAADLSRETGPGAADLVKPFFELRTILPRIPPAPPVEPFQERQRLFEGICDFLLQATQNAPWLIVLQDLHHSSESEARLLLHLVEHLGRGSILVLATLDRAALPLDSAVRRELTNRPGREAASPLNLGTLARAAAAKLAAAIARNESAPTRVPEGGATPLLIEELILDQTEGGESLLDENTSDAAFEDALETLLQRRFQRLPAATRAALGAASVLGCRIDKAALSSLATLEDTRLASVLEPALAARVLVQTTSQMSSVAPVEQYAFRHPRWQQWVYQQLSERQRERLHGRAISALESVLGDEVLPWATELAFHAQRAGTSISLPKAIDLWHRAGDLAWTACAPEQALRWWRAVLDRLPATGKGAERRAELLIQAGEIAILTPLDPTAGLAWLEEALAFYERARRPLRQARVHTRIGRNLMLRQPETQDLRRAVSHYGMAREIIENSGNRRSAGYLEAAIAATAFYRLRIGEGLEAARRALELAGSQGESTALPAAKALLGFHLWAAGQPAEGLALVEEAWERSDKAHHILLAVWRGEALLELLDPSAATRWYQKVRAQPGLALARRRLLRCQALAEMRGGRLAKAQALLRRAGPGSERYSWRMPAGAALGAETAFWGGDAQRAKALWTESLATARRSGDESAEEFCCGRLARLHRALGESTVSLELLEHSAGLAARGGQRVAELQSRVDLALLQTRACRRSAARQQVRRCREIILKPREWRGLAGRLILAEGALEGLCGHFAEAQSAVRQARALFRRLELAWDEAESLHQEAALLEQMGKPGMALARQAEAEEICRGTEAPLTWARRLVAVGPRN